jgi:hypothetical protein
MTRSNQFKGRKCFGSKNLHSVDKVTSLSAEALVP